MATTDQALNRIATLLEKQADIWQKHFGLEPAGPDDLLARIRKHAKLFSEGRAVFRASASSLATTIAAKLKDAGQRGLCSEIPAAKLAECFKSSGAGFDRKLLEDFAGVSRGVPERVEPATGAITPSEPDNETDDKELDTWEEVIDEKGAVVQYVKYERLRVHTHKPPDCELKAHRVNTHRPDTGLAAWEDALGEQTIYWGYVIERGQILWIGQHVHEFAPAHRDRFEVTLQWVNRTLGSNRFYNVGFTLNNSQPDGGFRVRRFENALFAELREILHLRSVQALLKGVRQDFETHATLLAEQIAAAFDKNRNKGNYTTAVLSKTELIDAFTNKDNAKGQNFEMPDFNEFANKWDTTFRSYTSNGTLAGELPKKQIWLEMVAETNGYYQRVTGSTETYVDPFRARQGVDGLLEVVLDAYLPGIGMCGSSRSLTAPPPPSYAVLLTYKLPGKRFLWVAQFFNLEQIYAHQMNNNAAFFIGLEWLETFDGKKQCYLVGDSFNITFGPNPSCEEDSTTPFLKASSKL